MSASNVVGRVYRWATLVALATLLAACSSNAPSSAIAERPVAQAQALSAWSATASDNFDRANGGLGSNWTVIDSNPRIVSQHVQETTASDGNDAIAIYTGLSWPANQYSQLTIRAASGNRGCAAAVRTKNSAVIEMYFVYVVGPLGPGAQLVLAKFVAHQYTQLWSSVLTVNADDVLYLSAEGSTLTVKLNGTTLTTQSDGSLTAGFPAIDVTDYDGGGAPAEAACDSWEGGILTDVPSIGTPLNLTGVATSSSQINLAWTAPSGAIAANSYNVYRGGTQVGTSLTTSFSDQGLALGTTYSYSVAAVDAAANVSPLSGSISVTTLGDTTPPSIPSNLTGSAASPTQINLTWQASTDAVAVAGYRVFRNGSLIGTPSTPSFNDQGLVMGSTYSYAVAAVDAAGNVSAASTSINVSTPGDTTPPSVPANLTGTATSSSAVNLTWLASTDDVSLAGYRVFRNGALIATPSTTPFTDSGLTASTSYSYSVAAVDAAQNTSAQSPVVVVTTPATSSSPFPVSDNFDRGNGTLGPNWTVIDSNPRIVNQQVQEVDPSDGNDSIAIYTALTWPANQYSQLTIRAAGPNNGCATAVRTKNDPVIEMYFVYVIGPLGPGAQLILAKFVGHHYTELWSSVLTVNAGDVLYLSANGTTLTVKLNGNTLTTQVDGSLTAAGYPAIDITDYGGGTPGLGQCDSWEAGVVTGVSAPTNLTGTAASSSQIDLSWTAPTEAVTGYNISRGGVQVGTSTSTSFSDVGLALGTSYTYGVSAFNAGGDVSPTSQSIIVATQGDTAPPTQPGNLLGTAVSSTQINLTWSASTDNVAVTGYRVFRNGSLIGTSASLSFADSGLTSATTYTYTVAAIDAAGNLSSLASTVVATPAVVDSTPPTVPAAVVGTALSPSSIALVWAASTDNVAVTGYRVFRNGSALGTSTSPSFVDSGLDPLTAYSYTVVAFDAAANTSAPSLPTVVVTLAYPDTTAPTVPSGLAGTAISSSRINLSWTAATDDVAVTGYRVFRDNALVGTSTTLAFADSGLAPVTTYTYTVAAIDGAGNVSALSSPSVVTTQAAPDTTPPSVPSSISGTAISANQITLTWTPATDNVAVTGYRVFRNGSLVGTPTSASFADGGLSPSTTYTYTVAAVDAAGNVSSLSAPAQVTTPAVIDTTPPTVPTGLVGTAVSSSQASLSWTASTDNVAVTGYRVFRNGSLIATTAAQSFADTGLTAATAYSYTIVAIDAAGNSSAASTAVVVTTTSASMLASDNFNRAAGGLGTNWTSIASNPQIFNQHVQEMTATDGIDAIAIYTGRTWADIQYSQVTVGAATASRGCAPVVRAAKSSNIQMYFVYVVGPLGPGAQLTLAKFVNHNYTELWSGVVPMNAGDTLYLGASGTTLTVKLNGTTLTTKTDSSISKGYPGFDITDYEGGGAPAEGQCDNWEGGTF